MPGVTFPGGALLGGALPSVALPGGAFLGREPCCKGALPALIGLAFLSSNFCKMLMHYFLIVSVGTWFPSSLHIFYIRFNIRPTGECLKPQSSKLSTSGYSNGVRPYEEFFTISTSFNQWPVIRKNKYT